MGTSNLYATVTPTPNELPLSDGSGFLADGWFPATSIFNVKRYGAISDGTADDTAAIASAVSACEAAGGGTVYFPQGIYETDQITVGSSVGITFRAADRLSSILRARTNTAPILAITGSDVNICGLGFDGAYVSGGTTGDFGIVDLTGTANIHVEDCYFKNGRNRAIKIRGACINTIITRCYFTNNFCSIQSGSNGGSNVPHRIRITQCEFIDNWGTGSESGAIKLQNLVSPDSSNNLVAHCTIKNVGQMGVEFWNGISDSIVSDNTISNVDWGISFDNCRSCTAEGNAIKLVSNIAIEAANPCRDILISDNILNGYTAGGARSGAHGIVTSNTPPARITIVGGSISGFSHALAFQTTTDVVVRGVAVNDCQNSVNIKSSSRIDIRSCSFAGPSDQGIWIENWGGNIADIALCDCTFRGACNQQLINFYDGDGIYLTDNVTITGNDVTKATVGAGGYTTIGSNLGGRLTNLQLLANVYLLTALAASLPDNSTVPYAPALQQYSIPVAAKFTFAVGSSLVSQWFKVFSWDMGRTITPLFHVEVNAQATDNTYSSSTFWVSAVPYGQFASITKFADGLYDGGSHIAPLTSAIYNNLLNGSVHEIWLRFAPTGGSSVTVAGADNAAYWITTPTAVTTEPTWASNHYETPIGFEDYFTARYHRADYASIGHIQGLVSYANNAAAIAAGLAVGAPYRLGDSIGIVH